MIVSTTTGGNAKEIASQVASEILMLLWSIFGPALARVIGAAGVGLPPQFTMSKAGRSTEQRQAS